MNSSRDQGVQSTAWRIVEYLQTQGTATHKQLEEYLGLTRTAIREHITTLESGGYVDRRTVHAGRGRPHHEYFNTDKARDLFACHCSSLAVTMLAEMGEVLDDKTLGLLMDRVAHKVAADYSAQMSAEDVPGRVTELAHLMQQQGILSRVHAGEDPASVQLELFNCPYHELAQENLQICDMDRTMIAQAVGAPVTLVDCIMEESSSCTFGFEVTPQGTKE